MTNYNEINLENGLKVLTAEDASLPTANILLVSRAGSRYEKDDESGYAHILEHMLLKGTAKRPSPMAISKEIDDRGGYKNAATNREFLTINLEIDNIYAENAIELLSDMLFNSLFDLATLENEKKVILEELRKSDDNPASYFSRFSFEKIFGAHPLSHNILGDNKTISEATKEKLIEYKKNFITPDRSAIIIAGNIAHDKAVELARKYFGKWRESGQALTPATIEPNPSKKYFIQKTANQTFIAFNFHTGNSLKESMALELIQNFLSFGGSSVLQERIRHREGLVYGISANNMFFTDTGLFSINTSASKPAEVIKSVSDIIAELPKLFSEDKLAEIKTRTIGALNRNIANPKYKIASLMVGFITRSELFTPEKYISEINGVSYGDISEVIKKYLTPDKMIITAMGEKDVFEK